MTRQEQEQHIEKLLRDAARRCAGQYIMPVNAGDLSLSELMMMAADLLEVRRDENGLEITREMIRDMTREECLDKGGFLTRIAGKLKPKQKVGDVFSEAEVKKLWKS